MFPFLSLSLSLCECECVGAIHIHIFSNWMNWVKPAGKSRWMKFELGNFLSWVKTKQNQFKLCNNKNLFPFPNEDHHHPNGEFCFFLAFSNGTSAVNQKYICHLISGFFFHQKWNSFFASIFFFVRYLSAVHIVFMKTICVFFYALSSIYYYVFPAAKRMHKIIWPKKKWKKISFAGKRDRESLLKLIFYADIMHVIK